MLTRILVLIGCALLVVPCLGASPPDSIELDTLTSDGLLPATTALPLFYTPEGAYVDSVSLELRCDGAVAASYTAPAGQALVVPHPAFPGRVVDCAICAGDVCSAAFTVDDSFVSDVGIVVSGLASGSARPGATLSFSAAFMSRSSGTAQGDAVISVVCNGVSQGSWETSAGHPAVWHVPSLASSDTCLVSASLEAGAVSANLAPVSFVIDASPMIVDAELSIPQGAVADNADLYYMLSLRTANIGAETEVEVHLDISCPGGTTHSTVYASTLPEIHEVVQRMSLPTSVRVASQAIHASGGRCTLSASIFAEQTRVDWMNGDEGFFSDEFHAVAGTASGTSSRDVWYFHTVDDNRVVLMPVAFSPDGGADFDAGKTATYSVRRAGLNMSTLENNRSSNLGSVWHPSNDYSNFNTNFVLRPAVSGMYEIRVTSDSGGHRTRIGMEQYVAGADSYSTRCGGANCCWASTSDISNTHLKIFMEAGRLYRGHLYSSMGCAGIGKGIDDRVHATRIDPVSGAPAEGQGSDPRSGVAGKFSPLGGVEATLTLTTWATHSYVLPDDDTFVVHSGGVFEYNSYFANTALSRRLVTPRVAAKHGSDAAGLIATPAAAELMASDHVIESLDRPLPPGPTPAVAPLRLTAPAAAQGAVSLALVYNDILTGTAKEPTTARVSMRCTTGRAIVSSDTEVVTGGPIQAVALPDLSSVASDYEATCAASLELPGVDPAPRMSAFVFSVPARSALSARRIVLSMRGLTNGAASSGSADVTMHVRGVGVHPSRPVSIVGAPVALQMTCTSGSGTAFSETIETTLGALVRVPAVTVDKESLCTIRAASEGMVTAEETYHVAAPDKPDNPDDGGDSGDDGDGGNSPGGKTKNTNSSTILIGACSGGLVLLGLLMGGYYYYRVARAKVSTSANVSAELAELAAAGEVSSEGSCSGDQFKVAPASPRSRSGSGEAIVISHISTGSGADSVANLGTMELAGMI